MLLNFDRNLELAALAAEEIERRRGLTVRRRTIR
jgi:hypothetical protein